ncbi:MAG: matrixin family metalloprotease [Candidatus Aenigmarchaeota archaeon]|nr:matrixin family metalloprotease [Candidatus Aenigmarchaeota archaeon]
MNLVNSVLGVMILALLVLVGYRAGQLFIDASSPHILETNHTKFTLPPESSYSLTLRWNHSPLKVYIDTSSLSNPKYADDFKNALNIWSSTEKILSFSITNNRSDADISVEWVSSLGSKSTDTLGNTDVKFVNTSTFNVIQNAHIQLLTKSNSDRLAGIDMTNLALHEIGHAIGLNHSADEVDVMYPVLNVPSSQVKQITQSDLQKLSTAYSSPAKPDLVATNAEVTKFTVRKLTTYYYANMTMTILNNGLTDSTPTSFLIKADGSNVKQLDISAIPIGDRLNIELGNLNIDHNFKSIEIVLDPNNSVDELNESNNVVDIMT